MTKYSKQSQAKHEFIRLADNKQISSLSAANKGSQQEKCEQQTEAPLGDVDGSKGSIFASRLAIPLFISLLLTYYKDGGNLNNSSTTTTGIRSELNQPLLGYAQFCAKFPRLKKPQEASAEALRRHLLFNLDLIKVGQQNSAYLSGRSKHLLGQSPFRSDRTEFEQLDVLSQFDEFDMEQMVASLKEQRLIAAASSRNAIDNPVSGIRGGSSSIAELQTGNKINKWITRLIKGDSHFEIPNYPLDAQPSEDPNNITHIYSDLRDCAGEIHDQLNCGACYAFSWNSLAEWHYCKQTGKGIDFSEQHLVDCGDVARLNGCTEGKLGNARVFTYTFGFHLEKNYPYKGKKGRCFGTQGSISMKTADFKRLKVDRDEWEQVLMEQPILVEVHLPEDISSYHRGIHSGENCVKDRAHGMLLVGHGLQEGKPYWLLKNSMGKKWGENGYLRLSRDSDVMRRCFNTGFVSKFRFKDVNEEDYNSFYDQIKFEPSAQLDENE